VCWDWRSGGLTSVLGADSAILERVRPFLKVGEGKGSGGRRMLYR
jgi:hypothetical protein